MRPYGHRHTHVPRPTAQDGEVHPPVKGGRGRARHQARVALRFALWLHFVGALGLLGCPRPTLPSGMSPGALARCPSGPELHTADGSRPDPRTCALVELLHARAVASCPAERQAELERHWTHAWITWHVGGCDHLTGGFPCPGSGARVAGCATTNEDLHVGCIEAVPAELGHTWHWACGDGSGEAWLPAPDGGVRFWRDPDYAQWVETGKASLVGLPVLDAGAAAAR